MAKKLSLRCDQFSARWVDLNQRIRQILPQMRRAEPTELRLSIIDTVNGDTDKTGLTFKLGVKDPAAVSGTTFLFEATDSEVSGFTDLAAGKVAFAFTPESTALNAFLGASDAGKLVRLEIVALDGTGAEDHIIASDLVQMIPDVIRGSETTTTTT